DLRLIDQTCDGRLSRRDETRVAYDDDALRYAADLHLDVEHRRLSNRNVQARVVSRPEPGQLDRDGVLAGRESVRAIPSLSVGRHGATLPRLDVLHGYRRARQRRLRFVSDDARDRSGGPLRTGDRGRAAYDRRSKAEDACQRRCSEY